MPDHIQPLAVITGASSGIGRELAKLAAQKGYRLLLIARNMRALEVLSRDLRTETHLLALDLTAAGAVDQISSWLSDRQIVPEIFINNAGFGAFGPASDMDEAMLKKMIRLNVMALTSLSLRMARRMKREGRGRIMNVASTAAFQPCPYLGVYGATKIVMRWLNVSRLFAVWDYPVLASYRLEGAGVGAQAVVHLRHPCILVSQIDARPHSAARRHHRRLERHRPGAREARSPEGLPASSHRPQHARS